MCNLYSVTKGQQAIRELARAMRDRTGNLPPLYGIFPDYAAPIVRNQPEGRELMMARWGMPSPVFALKGKKPAARTEKARRVVLRKGRSLSPAAERFVEMIRSGANRPRSRRRKR